MFRLSSTQDSCQQESSRCRRAADRGLSISLSHTFISTSVYSHLISVWLTEIFQFLMLLLLLFISHRVGRSWIIDIVENTERERERELMCWPCDVWFNDSPKNCVYLIRYLDDYWWKVRRVYYHLCNKRRDIFD